MSTTDKPTGIGLSEAASRIEALLDSASADNPPAADQAPASNAAETDEKIEVEATAADDAANKTPPSDTDDGDTIEPDDKGDGTADESADDVGDAADEATADGGKTDDDASDAPQLFTVKVDGKEEQVELKELLAGYSRTASYTRKSQALAEERKAFESEKQAVQLERQQYAQLLPALVEMLKEGMAEPDWDALADNPTEYIRQERLWRERQERIAAAQAEQQRLKQIAEEEAKAELANAIRNSGAELVKAMPQWKNPDRWAADRAKLIDYGKQMGFSEEELKQVYDHRAILVLWKARQYDELMAKRPKPAPSSGPKPAKAGAAPQQPRREVTELTRAKQRLAKTGRVRDAATIFEHLL